MATVGEWIKGGRLWSLPASVAPVLAGTGVAVYYNGFHPGKAALALMVSALIHVGVNYSNDYSDGIRGTDDEGVLHGQQWMVASGIASPKQVLTAALTMFGLAAVAGLALVIWTGAWIYLGIGAVSIFAAWSYSGGKNPYGYLGLGDIAVFLFFGIVAVTGTVYVQLGYLPEAAWWTAIAMGALVTAILEPDNLRDLETDRKAGKITLAVRLGDRGTRWFYVGLLSVAGVAIIRITMLTTWWALVGLAMVLLAVVGPVRMMLSGASGNALGAVVRNTSLATLVGGIGLLAGLAVG